jgi:hypothetical protein
VVFNTLVNFSKLLRVLKYSLDLQVFFRVSMTILEGLRSILLVLSCYS